ncbi:hypothetical protein IW262DRAFT_1469098 [Armillaria fumosa]|nr:hypothetical protein IW262DRAFT_1469098 [Armillaria fumosa]
MSLTEDLNYATAIFHIMPTTFKKAYKALQKHNVAFRRDPETVEDHVLSTLRSVKRSTGLSLHHGVDKETMDIEILADTFLFQFQPILAEQKNLTATAVETANLNPMMAFALSLGAKQALWLGLQNKKASNDNISLIRTVLSQFGEVMSIRYCASVPVPYASLVVFFADVYAAMNALIGLEKGGNLLTPFAGSEVKFAKWNGVEDPPEVQRVVISGLTIPVPSQELLYIFSTYLGCHDSPSLS